MEKKLFFFDIDGTLIDCAVNIREMTEKTKYSLNTLKENGHQIFIASGRACCFMPKEIQDFDFDGYISCNGASIQYHGQKIYEDNIELDKLKRLEQFATTYNLIYYLEEDEKIYTNKFNDPRVKTFAQKWQMDLRTIHPISSLESLKVHIAMIDCQNKEILEKAKNYFKADFDVQVHPNQYSTDLTLQTSSKGKGIAYICQYLNLNLEDTIAFGDGPNDIEMFETVALPLAMKNAVKELKEKAYDIVNHVEEEGIYQGLVKYRFIDEIS